MRSRYKPVVLPLCDNTEVPAAISLSLRDSSPHRALILHRESDPLTGTKNQCVKMGNPLILGPSFCICRSYRGISVKWKLFFHQFENHQISFFFFFIVLDGMTKGKYLQWKYLPDEFSSNLPKIISAQLWSNCRATNRRVPNKNWLVLLRRDRNKDVYSSLPSFSAPSLPIQDRGECGATECVNEQQKEGIREPISLVTESLLKALVVPFSCPPPSSYFFLPIKHPNLLRFIPFFFFLLLFTSLSLFPPSGSSTLTRYFCTHASVLLCVHARYVTEEVRAIRNRVCQCDDREKRN